MTPDLSTKTYHIWTLGCQMNESDSERIARVFEELGVNEATSETTADFIVVNTCSVKQKAEDRVYGKMRDYRQIKKKRPDTKIIITGCMIGKVSRNYKKDNATQIHKNLKRRLPDVDYFMDISNLALFKEQLAQGTLSDDLLSQLRDETTYLEIHAKHTSSFRAFVPIMTGCNNFCKFCIVPYSRGREKSRSRADIISEITNLIQSGIKEITLVGQNVNSYKDKEVPEDSPYQMPFANLLYEVNNIPGNFRIFFTSPHPKDFSPEVIHAVANLPKCTPQIHLPLQAGNPEVLKNMRRPYTIERFLEIMTDIRTAIPHVSLTTDIVVGFPGETAEQFEDTLHIIRKAKFDMAFVGRFSPREGTEAFDMDDNVTAEEKERREHAIDELVRENNRAYMSQFKHKPIRVLVDRAKTDPETNTTTYFGRTDGLKPIKFTAGSDRNLIGKFATINVTQINNWSMQGEFVDLDPSESSDTPPETTSSNITFHYPEHLTT